MVNKKGTILYIHGNSSSSRVFEGLLNSENIRYAQIAPDLPGHGVKANSNKVFDFCTDTYCNFLLNIIKDINEEILLVGNSLGGHLALEIAPKVENLKGLILFGAPPVQKPLNIQEAFHSVPALNTFLSENPNKNEIQNAFLEVVSNENHVQGFVKDFEHANPKVRSALVNDLQLGTWSDQAKIFLSLRIPKLLIIGDKDISVNSNYIKKLANEDKHLSSLVYFENCGHYASIEKPKKFEYVLLEMADKVFHQ